jgi:pimeloyl-ACP methyl ester carboxylesterase
VLVVGAEHDAATGVEAVDLVARCFPRAETVVLPQAGHFPWVDEPAAFRSAVSTFLSRVGT